MQDKKSESEEESSSEEEEEKAKDKAKEKKDDKKEKVGDNFCLKPKFGINFQFNIYTGQYILRIIA